MKKCPFCLKDQQEDALYCDKCGRPLTGEQKKKWYFRVTTLIIAFVSIGPLALPLVWFNPHLSRRAKIAVTVIVSVATYFLVLVLIESIKVIYTYYHTIFTF